MAKKRPAMGRSIGKHFQEIISGWWTGVGVSAAFLALGFNLGIVVRFVRGWNHPKRKRP